MKDIAKKSNYLGKYESAVTLIALVITIIVLLILAGVSLNIVIGESGIFSKADIAKKQTNESQFLENIKIALVQYALDLNTDKEKAKENLEKNINSYGYSYKYNEDGSSMNVIYMSYGAKITMKDGKVIYFNNGNFISIAEREIKLYLNKENKTNYKLNVTTNIDKLNWKSSDESIATINNEGIVSAVNIGKCNIMVSGTFDGKEYEDNIEVEVGNLVEEISLNKTNSTLIKSNNTSKNKLEENLIATISNSNASDKKIIWTSSNPNVATVNENGVVNAVNAGECTIEAKANDESEKLANCKVKVEERKYVYDYGQKFESITGGWTAYDRRCLVDIL